MRNQRRVTRNTRKNKTHIEMYNQLTPRNAILPETYPKKKRKSDLTLSFVNPSDYVNSLAFQSQRAGEIDRMRQNAVSHQWSDSGSRKGKVVSTKDQLQAFKTLADDSTKVLAMADPGLVHNLHNCHTMKQRSNRAMDAKSFKKRYSSVGISRLGLPALTMHPSPVIMRRGLKSRFRPDFGLGCDIGSGQRDQEPKNQEPEHCECSESNKKSSIPSLDSNPEA